MPKWLLHQTNILINLFTMHYIKCSITTDMIAWQMYIQSLWPQSSSSCSSSSSFLPIHFLWVLSKMNFVQCTTYATAVVKFDSGLSMLRVKSVFKLQFLHLSANREHSLLHVQNYIVYDEYQISFCLYKQDCLIQIYIQLQSSRWASVLRPKTSKTLFGSVHFSVFI